MTTNLYWYRATVDRVVDGDTVDMIIDLGMNVFVRERLRLYGIDAPEVRGPERPQGLLATEHIKELLASYERLEIQTYKDKKGKYGRYLATIYGIREGDLPPDDINAIMINDGHAERADF